MSVPLNLITVVGRFLSTSHVRPPNAVGGTPDATENASVSSPKNASAKTIARTILYIQ